MTSLHPHVFAAEAHRYHDQLEHIFLLLIPSQRVVPMYPPPTGTILVSVNPFKALPLYTTSVMERYRNAAPPQDLTAPTEPPHAYEVSLTNRSGSP
jgi:hypothetical protein